MKQHKGFLVVSGSGEMRVLKRLSSMRPDEVAFRITVNIPDGWGRIVGDIEVTMPEPPVEALVREHVLD